MLNYQMVLDVACFFLFEPQVVPLDEGFRGFLEIRKSNRQT